MFTHVIRILSVLAIVSVSSVAALAQEKVTLRLNLPPGTAWSFDQSEQIEMNMNMSANGPQQQMQQKMSRRIAGTTEVVEANNGVPTVLRFTFDRESGGQMEAMGQQQQVPFPLAGQTVTVRLEHGDVTSDYKGPMEEQVRQELRTLSELGEQFLPKQPVAIGESWAPDREALARTWQVDPMKDKFDVGVTLKEVKEMDGRRVAVLEMDANILGDFPGAQGISGARKIKGTALLDLNSGRMTSADASGTFEASGVQDMQGMKVNVQSKGTMTSTMRTQLKEGGVAGNDAPGGGAMPAGGGGAPVPEPGLPAGGAAAYAGIFKDNQMTIELSESGGQYTGTITMGDQKFPVKAQMRENQLVGTFQSNGNMFDFTASLNGDTLNLKTGNTEHRLTKETRRKNPLAR